MQYENKQKHKIAITAMMNLRRIDRSNHLYHRAPGPSRCSEHSCTRRKAVDTDMPLYNTHTHVGPTW